MSWKRTIYAFVIFILMLMALALDTKLMHNRTITIIRDASLADSVDVSAVDSIYLKNNQGAIRLVRTTVGWQMKEPVDAPADTEIVETVLTNVTGARRRNEIEAKNLAQYGLANPEIQLTLGSDTGAFGDWGTSYGLELGYESTYTGQVFARYPTGDKVFTVSEHVKNTLLRSPMDFRRTRILDVDTGNLEKYKSFEIKSYSPASIELEGAADEVVKIAREGSEWKIVEPTEAAAEQRIVQEYFDRLGMLRAMSYVTEGSDFPTSMTNALAALSSPTLGLTLEGASGVRPQYLNIAVADGVNGPVYVAQRPGEREIMVLSEETISELRRNDLYFRSRELFNMDLADVGMFTIQIARGAPMALVRSNKENDEWELVGDPEFRIDQAAVNERLAALVGLRIEDYVEADPTDLTQYGLDNPRIRFTITTRGEEKSESLEVGALDMAGGTLSYARSSATEGIFKVKMTREMLIVPAQIADKNFAAVDPTRLVRAEIDVDDETYKLQRSEDEWEMLKPEQTAYQTVDNRQVGLLFGMINGLQYDEDITASSQVVVAPDKGPALAVRFYDADDNLLNEMIVTARINRQTSLVTNGRDRTFEVSTMAIEKIYAAAKNLVR